ncbi:MAG: hypothetical protein EOO40_03145 [Deltaproteobacteria bacterium]|nr:MAG: hypothetical protein EOO40_03145 [Deltaproteobacteria bacterium]
MTNQSIKSGRMGAWALWGSFAAALVGCGEPECGGQLPTATYDAPRILAMEVAKSPAQDPWRLVLATEFVDQGGDLAGGVATMYAGGETGMRTSQALAGAFEAAAGLASDAVHGVIALPVGIASSTVDGAHLRLGTQLVDSSQNRSNCYVLNLSFAISASPKVR